MMICDELRGGGLGWGKGFTNSCSLQFVAKHCICDDDVIQILSIAGDC